MVWILSLLFAVFLPVSSALAGEALLTADEFYSSYNPTYLKLDGSGNLWTAYHGMNGEVFVKNLTEKRQFKMSEGEGKRYRGFIMEVEGNNIYMSWCEKSKEGKKLYFRAIYDGKTLAEPVLLDNNATEALTRIKIGASSGGNIQVVWYGERMVDSSKYHLYAASSNDFGKTFSEPRNLTRGYLNSIYPTILMDDQTAYVFSYSMTDRKQLMMFRKTTDNGKTWSEPAIIRELDGTVTLFVNPVKVGKRLHVFWYTTTEKGPMVEQAWSDDEGTTWKTRVFEETRAFDITLLNVAHDNKGRIYMALSGRTSETKDKVYILRSEDNGSTWDKLKPLRHYPYETTMATKPLIRAEDDGTVVVVWTDYRNIRRNLYMQYSLDGGKTWQEKDMPLVEPGKLNTSYWPYTNDLVLLKGRYYLLASRYRDDRLLEDADLVLLDFDIKGGVR
jgi:hypothetical protein